MKSKLVTAYPSSVFLLKSINTIYIADFSERTDKKRGVEIHDNPIAIDDKSELIMDFLIVHNDNLLPIHFNIFDDHQFKDNENNDITHCECCFFPEENNENSFIAFVEIKDCKPKNLSIYKNTVKEQIISTVQQFKSNGIILKNELYGIISFPRNKISFNNAIFCDPFEYKNLYRKYKIHFIPQNEVFITDNKITIKPY